MTAIAHHQPPAPLITLVGERRDVGLDLGLQRLGQHPAGRKFIEFYNTGKVTAALYHGTAILAFAGQHIMP